MAKRKIRIEITEADSRKAMARMNWERSVSDPDRLYTIKMRNLNLVIKFLKKRKNFALSLQG